MRVSPFKTAAPFCAALLVCAGAAHADLVTLDDLPTAPPAQILILGEIHDNPNHHETQAALVQRWQPTALVFEMLTPAQAAAIGDTPRDNVARMAEMTGWATSGWPGYAMYHPIFAASGTAEIYGAALDRVDVRRAMTDGAGAVFGPDAALYGLASPLPAPEQALRETDQMTAHCNALPPEMLPGMVAAQRLRDAAFARTALQALEKTGGPVVVITGSGHADRARGIPAALGIAAPAITAFSLGQVEGDPGPDAPFDAWIVTAPTPRDDPCAAFTKTP
jgi:uncharacterized iron-regulated protein